MEAQELFWGVKHGPIYVTTGPIWRRFPSKKFESIRNGLVDTASYSETSAPLTKLDGEALPLKIPRPTGFFTVVFKPGAANEPDRAIAFLAPHTKQEGLSSWHFVATVKLVEEASGLRFGFADDLKNWPDLSYWNAGDRMAPNKWDLRGNCKTKLPVAGWMANQPVKDRITMCKSSSSIN